MKLFKFRKKTQSNISYNELYVWVKKTIPIPGYSSNQHEIIKWQSDRIWSMGYQNTVGHIIQLEKILDEGIIKQSEPEDFKIILTKQINLIHFSLPFPQSKQTKFESQMLEQRLDRSFINLKDDPLQCCKLVLKIINPEICAISSLMSIRYKKEGCLIDFLLSLNLTHN